MRNTFRLLLLVILLSVSAGCAPGTFPERIIADSRPSVEEEKLLGDRLSTLLVQYLDGEYPDGTLKDYINRVGQHASPDGDKGPALVSIANHPHPLSLSLPGGHIIVSLGLLQELENEGQLAVLLAAETARIRAGYVSKQMKTLISGRSVFLQEVRPGEAGYSQLLRLVRELLQLSQPVSGDVPEAYPDDRSHENSNSAAFAHHLDSLREAAPAYALYHQARKAEAADDRSAALQLYHQSIQQHPRSPLLTALGMAYLRAEDLIPARRYLRQAVMDDADFYQSRLGLGYIHLQRSEWSDAVAELEASLALLPTVQGVFLLAEAEDGRGNSLRARNLYQHLVDADGQSALGRAAADRLRQLPR